MVSWQWWAGRPSRNILQSLGSHFQGHFVVVDIERGRAPDSKVSNLLWHYFASLKFSHQTLGNSCGPSHPLYCHGDPQIGTLAEGVSIALQQSRSLKYSHGITARLSAYFKLDISYFDNVPYIVIAKFYSSHYISSSCSQIC